MSTAQVLEAGICFRLQTLYKMEYPSFWAVGLEESYTMCLLRGIVTPRGSPIDS